MPLNLFLAKDLLTGLAADYTGLQLKLSGPVRLRLGLAPQLDVVNFSVAQNDVEILRAENLQIQMRLPRLLGGNLYFRSVSAAELSADFCAPDFAEISNALPQQPASSGEETATPAISFGQLAVSNMRLSCNNEPVASFTELTASDGTRIEASGTLLNEAVELTVNANPISDIISSKNTGPLQLELHGDELHLTFDGKADWSDSPAAIGRLNLSARSLTQLNSDLPDANIRVEAGLALSEDLLNVTDSRVILNSQPVLINRLEASLDEDPKLAADIAFQEIDISKVLGLLESGTGTDIDKEQGQDTGEESETGTASTDAAEPAAVAPVVELLREWDADVRLTADEIQLPEGTLHSTAATLLLENGLVDSNVEAAIKRGTGSNGNAEDGNLTATVNADFTDSSGDNCPPVVINTKIKRIAAADIEPFLPANSDYVLKGLIDRAALRAGFCGFNQVAWLNTLTLDTEVAGDIGVSDTAGDSVTLRQLSFEGGADKTIVVSARGAVVGTPLTGKLRLGSGFNNLIAGPVNFELRSDTSVVSIQGDIVNINEMRLQVEASSPDISKLNRLSGVDIGGSLAAKLSGRLTVQRGFVDLAGLHIQLGESVVNGNLHWDENNPDEAVAIRLHSPRLNIQEIMLLDPEDDADEYGQDATGDNTDTDSLPFVNSDFSLPAGRVEIAVDHITGMQVKLYNFSIEGDLQDRAIRNAQIHTDLENLTFDGSLNANLEKYNLSVDTELKANNINIGGLLRELGFNTEAQGTADSMSLSYQAEAAHIGPLLRNGILRADLKNMTINAAGSVSGIPLNAQLEHLYLEAAPDQPSRWAANGMFNGVKVRSVVKSAPLEVALDTTQPLPVLIALHAGEDLVAIDLTMEPAGQDRFAVQIDLSGAYVGESLPDLNALELPLSDFRFRTHLVQTPRQLNLNDIAVSSANSSATGDAELRVFDDHRELSLNLHSPKIEIRDFAGLFADPEMTTADAAQTEEAATGEIPDAEQQPESTQAGLETNPDEELDEDLMKLAEDTLAQFLDENWFEVSLAADNIESDGYRIGGGRLTAVSDNESVRIDPVTIRSRESLIEATFESRELTNNRRSAKLNIQGENFDFGALLPLILPDAPASGGKLYIDTQLETVQPYGESLAAGINGHIELGVVPEDVPADILDLWAGNLLLAMLPTPDLGGTQKQLNCMVVRFKADNGVLKSNSILLDSTDIIVRGRGEIDLDAGTVNIVTVPQAKREKFFSVSAPVRISGPLNDFEVGLEGAGFIGIMFRWWYSLVYVPFKWLTGEEFPQDGLETCYIAMGWEE